MSPLPSWKARNSNQFSLNAPIAKAALCNLPDLLFGPNSLSLFLITPNTLGLACIWNNMLFFMRKKRVPWGLFFDKNITTSTLYLEVTESPHHTGKEYVKREEQLDRSFVFLLGSRRLQREKYLSRLRLTSSYPWVYWGKTVRPPYLSLPICKIRIIYDNPVQGLNKKSLQM